MSHGSEWEHNTQQEILPDDAVAALLGAVVDVTMTLKPDGTIRNVADDGTPTLGYPPDELTGQPITSLVPAEPRPSSMFDVTNPEEVDATVLGSETETVRIPLEAADGSVVPLSLTTVSHPAADGPICLGRETSEGASRDRRAQDDLLDLVADPLYVLDSADRFERVNDALVEYTGYERADLRGRELSEILPATTYTRARRNLRDLVDDDGRQSDAFETTFVTKDGERLLTEAHVTPLTDDDGNYDGAVGVLRDIRERKHREQNLDLLNQVLTRVFRHNVRNELMVVQGRAQHLDESIDDDLREHTRKILQRSERLLGHSEKARLIERVIETETLTELDITDEVVTVVEAARDEYPGATIDVELPSEAVVEGHPAISRAIQEIVENAIEHAPDAETAQVDIWLDQRDGTQTLFVEDESGGLANHEISVLERGAESELEHSSGVGLWLIRWLVEYSEAEMIVHRTSGGSLLGIRFEQTAPDSVGDVADAPLANAPAHVREISPQRFRGDTVIGRVGTLERLDDIYDSLERSGGHSVLVTGEAGVGKSTLVEQFRAQLSDQDPGPLLASGFCDSETQPAYHAFRQVLADVPSERDVSEILADAASLSADGPEELQQRKRALFTEIADELRAVSADRPVVLLVEDMHWADQGTIDLFEYLVEEVGRWGNPVMFLGTYRTSGVDRSHPVLEIAETTAEAGRGTVIELEPFGEDDVESLLSHILDIEHVPASFVAAVHAHTGGTPLFVNELARHLFDALGQIQSGEDLPETLDEVSVPETVESAITERLAALPAEVLPVVRLGAVIGREFSFDLLRAASDRPVDSLIECSNTLVGRQVWRQTADGIEFVHGVVREQVLDAIPDAERTTLHATVAAAIETVHEDALDEYAARLGSHYEQVGEYDTAFEYYRQAGAYASDAYANEDAIEQYDLALSLADEYDVADETTVTTVRSAVGEIYLRLGEYEQAREYFERALDTAQAVDDRHGTATNLYNLGRVAQNRNQYEQAREYLDRGLDIFRDVGDRKGEAKCLSTRGIVALRRGDHDNARESAERSLSINQELGDRDGEVGSRSNLGIICLRGGEYDRAQEQFEHALSLSQDLGDPHKEAAALNQLGLIAFRRNEYDEGWEYYQQSLDIRREIGDRGGEAACLHNLAFVAFRRGEYDQAREYYERSLTISQTIGDRNVEALSLVNLVLIAYDRGAYDQVHEYAERSLDIYREIGVPRGEALSLVGFGMHANVRGNLERARDVLTDSLEIAREVGLLVPKLMGSRELGAVARKQGAYDEAAQHLDSSLDACEESEHRHERAKTHLERARLALARDDIETAREAVDRAHSIFTELGATPHEARATLLRGRIAARTDSPDRAREHWRNALETFEEIDAPRETLQTLGHLVETCRQQGDDEGAREHRERARMVFENAPEPVQENHGEWLDTGSG
jgi:PAS domain S-box-containing protein